MIMRVLKAGPNYCDEEICGYQLTLFNFELSQTIPKLNLSFKTKMSNISFNKVKDCRIVISI